MRLPNSEQLGGKPQTIDIAGFSMPKSYFDQLYAQSVGVIKSRPELSQLGLEAFVGRAAGAIWEYLWSRYEKQTAEGMVYAGAEVATYMDDIYGRATGLLPDRNHLPFGQSYTSLFPTADMLELDEEGRIAMIGEVTLQGARAKLPQLSSYLGLLFHPVFAPHFAEQVELRLVTAKEGGVLNEAEITSVYDQLLNLASPLTKGYYEDKVGNTLVTSRRVEQVSCDTVFKTAEQLIQSSSLYKEVVKVFSIKGNRS